MPAHPQPASLTRLLFHWLVPVLAVAVAATHAALITGISFRAYAWITLIAAGAVGLIAARAISGDIRRMQVGGAPGWIMGAAALGGSLLSVLSHRPSPDSCYYVPNAVYALKHPDAAMGFTVHYLAANGEAFRSIAWGTAFPFEYLQAVAAYFLGLEFLDIYYIAAPALNGLFIPPALYFLISRFVPEARTAAAATVLTLLALLQLGETAENPGNFLFTRIFEGKAVLFAVGLPLLCAVSIDCLRDRSARNWLMVCLTAMALSGLSSSAMILLPPLAALLCVAHLAASPHRREALKTAGIYLLALAYPVINALLLAVFGGHGNSAVVSASYPTTFLGHAAFFVDPALPVTPLAFGLSCIAALLLAQARERRFLGAWLAAAVLLLLNPLAAPLLIEHVTSPGIYWRLFYLLPFPLVLGLAIAYGITRSSLEPGTRTWWLTCGGAALCLMLPHLWTNPASAFQAYRSDAPILDRVTFGPPGYKLPETPLADARAVLQAAPPGPMLAPSAVACIVSMLSGEHPQMRIRSSGVRAFMAGRGTPEEAELRMQASDFTGGAVHKYTAFKRLVENRLMHSIVMTGNLADRGSVADLLAQNGYVHRRRAGNLTVVYRDPDQGE